MMGMGVWCASVEMGWVMWLWSDMGRDTGIWMRDEVHDLLWELRC